MFSIFTGFASLIIPGLGQLLHGELIAGFLFFLAFCIAGPVVGVVAAIHAAAI